MIVWWITKVYVKSVVEYSKDGSTWLHATNWEGPQKYERNDEKHGSYKSGAFPFWLSGRRYTCNNNNNAMHFSNHFYTTLCYVT